MKLASPPDLWRTAWQKLARATVDKKHNFSTATLSTVHTIRVGENVLPCPRTRTVVLRKVDAAAGAVFAYTDARSVKVGDLERGPSVAHWCFWDRKSSMQIAAAGIVSLVSGKEATERYLSLPKHSRKAYATRSAPSTPLTADGDGLPDDWADMNPSETDYAADNFLILRTDLLEIDLLLLSRGGHRRLHAVRPGAGLDWAFEWVVP